MCIYHSVPLLDYVISAPDPQLFASMNTSFPVPELDAIGLEPITVAYYSNNPIERAIINVVCLNIQKQANHSRLTCFSGILD